jgi:hypothetical protein
MMEQFWADKNSRWTEEKTSKLGLRLARIYLSEGRFVEAEQLAEEVIIYESRKTSSRNLFFDASDMLSFIYTAQGQLEKSLKINSDII